MRVGEVGEGEGMRGRGGDEGKSLRHSIWKEDDVEEEE